ncbi:MAG TPA: hypothetical protein VHD35_12135 [Chitinophagaceae bacterium]|nr:hypothetical protein [Chitinophagaceae bacterium]
MGKNQETKKIRVKELRKEVQQKLAVALADYKNGWPDEKYNKTLKKASKLFVTDLERVEQKVRTKKKKKDEQVVEEASTGE